MSDTQAECKHCYHIVWSNHTNFYTEDKSVCCHCGNERVTKIEHSKTSCWSMDISKHGPYAPRIAAHYRAV